MRTGKLVFLAALLFGGVCFAEETEGTETKEIIRAYREAPTDLIEEYLKKMEETPAQMNGKYLLLRYSEEEQDTVLPGFSIYDPSVFEDETETELADLTAAANWAIYDWYRGQMESEEEGAQREGFLRSLEDFFGDEWRDVKGLDFASGRRETENGSYYWLPVYYEKESGGLEENTLYLFVYLIREGADADTLDGKFVYAVYGEYRTEKLLIADRDCVAEFMTALKESGGLMDAEKPEEYETLVMDSTGEAVRALQKALLEEGYLESSVDGYYGVMTQEAVIKFQEANGMEPTGEADADLQAMLLSEEGEKRLLENWLAGQNGGE